MPADQSCRRDQASGQLPSRAQHPQEKTMATQLTPEAVNSPDPTADPPAAAARTGGLLRLDADTLITIADIRRIFRLGRTAAYELAHRPGFPDPV